jgi:3-hydroxy-3-methylglutaryl CoA synthase/uncharacterized OB-fold protein
LRGITSYSVYIPRHRLARETIARAWGTKTGPGCKAVCGFDEDSLTMAQAALWPLARNVQRVYFASTTSPFLQRSVSSQIAAACDLPASVATADFAGSLRAGTSALQAALESNLNVAVVAADQREPEPESADEMLFGDGAAALSIGSEAVIAECIGSVSRSDDFLDEWRRDNDPFVRGFAGKFSQTHGYATNVSAAARELIERTGVKPDRIIANPGIAKQLGIACEDPRLGDIGFTGAAHPLLLLALALERVKAGEAILLTSYGDGADALLFRATRDAEPRLSLDRQTIPYPSYTVYRKLRASLRSDRGGPEISNVLHKREESQNVRLHGSFCPKCETLHYPMTRVCEKCRNAEGLVEKPLARTGRVFTFNKDYLYDSPSQPTILAVVECDGGGRILCQMTDSSEVEIGMPVELVLRRMRDGEAVRHYYWKCRPIDGSGLPADRF